MASSFVTFDVKIDDNSIGFWIHDSLFEVVCAHMLLVIRQESIDIPGWLKEMEELIKDNSLGYFQSFMHIDFDVYLADNDRKGTFLGIIDKAKQKLSGKESLTTEELDSLLTGNIARKWTYPLTVSRLIKAFIYLELLIKGQLEIKVGDPDTYW